jgi:hypothetical protein
LKADLSGSKSDLKKLQAQLNMGAIGNATFWLFTTLHPDHKVSVRIRPPSDPIPGGAIRDFSVGRALLLSAAVSLGLVILSLVKGTSVGH